jgi:hypothetical protein
MSRNKWARLVCGAAGEKLRIFLSRIPVLPPVIFISLDALKSMWLATGLQETPT